MWRGRLLAGPSLPLVRQKVEEAGNRYQARIFGDDAEIGALRQRRAAFRNQFPREPDTVVMNVHLTDAAEPMPWKFCLYP